MNLSPATLILLTGSVLALLIGPIAIVLFMSSPLALAAGTIGTGLGALGLWVGMGRIKP